MNYERIDGPDGLEIRIPRDESYRTCTECGGDCDPDPSPGVDDLGARIAYICPLHGVHSIVDPLAGQR